MQTKKFDCFRLLIIMITYCFFWYRFCLILGFLDVTLSTSLVIVRLMYKMVRITENDILFIAERQEF